MSRSSGELAAIVSRGPNELTTEALTLLNVATHMSIDHPDQLSQEIDLAGACFIGRTASPHESLPTARYYAFARPHSGLSPSTTWSAQQISHLSALWTWLGLTLSHSAFMFTQGWLTGVAIQRPVFAFPIDTEVYASCLRYFNMTCMDTVRWMGSRLVDGSMFGIYLI